MIRPNSHRADERKAMNIYDRPTPLVNAADDVTLRLSGRRERLHTLACRLEQENGALKDLLTRIRAWDMMDAAADGKYWRGEIDEVLHAIEERK